LSDVDAASGLTVAAVAERLSELAPRDEVTWVARVPAGA
jgi:hypothetical protein